FKSRIAQLKAKEEARLAANLPGITLAVSNASLADVISALNETLDTATKLQYVNDGNPGGTYTLDVKNKPFWEIVSALQQQQPFSLNTVTTSGPTGSTQMLRVSSASF